MSDSDLLPEVGRVVAVVAAVAALTAAYVGAVLLLVHLFIG